MSTVGPAATLLAATRAHGGDVVAVVGTAKHVGKTSMVGALLREAERVALRCGVLSLGRDGEAHDAFDDREKPRLRLPAETLAVLPRSSLRAGLPVKLCETLQATSALGELVVVRTTAAVATEVTGPPSGVALRDALETLRKHGAQRLFIDGALDRIAPLSTVDPVFIFATGIAAGADIGRVADHVAALAERLRLPAPPERDDLHAVTGAIDGDRLRECLAAHDARDLVIDDPLRMTHDAFLVARRLRRLWSKRRYRIAGCCVNAYALTRSCDPRRLGLAVAKAAELPTVDCVAGAVYAHA